VSGRLAIERIPEVVGQVHGNRIKDAKKLEDVSGGAEKTFELRITQLKRNAIRN
jgi:hypothetical protein